MSEHVRRAGALAFPSAARHDMADMSHRVEARVSPRPMSAVPGFVAASSEDASALEIRIPGRRGHRP